MSKKIIALTKPIVDEQTDVECNFHVMESVYIHFQAQMTQATFRSYVSQKSYDKGKHFVGVEGIPVQINQAPPEGVDTVQWIYQNAANYIVPASENTPTILTDAVVVEVNV